MNSHSIPPKSQPQGDKDYLRYWVETLKLAVQFASHHEAKPSAPRRGTRGSLPAPLGSPLVAKRLCRGALARN